MQSAKQAVQSIYQAIEKVKVVGEEWGEQREPLEMALKALADTMPKSFPDKEHERMDTMVASVETLLRRNEANELSLAGANKLLAKLHSALPASAREKLPSEMKRELDEYINFDQTRALWDELPGLNKELEAARQAEKVQKEIVREVRCSATLHSS